LCISFHEKCVKHFVEDQVYGEVHGNQLIEKQVEAHECLKDGHFFILFFAWWENVVVLIPVIVEPNSSSDLRHQEHLYYHDNQINEKDNIQLVCQAANLELVLTLVQHLFRILPSINHQRIHVARVFHKCTPWNELFQV
jgi:hypothetical protein